MDGRRLLARVLDEAKDFHVVRLPRKRISGLICSGFNISGEEFFTLHLYPLKMSRNVGRETGQWRGATPRSIGDFKRFVCLQSVQCTQLTILWVPGAVYPVVKQSGSEAGI